MSQEERDPFVKTFEEEKVKFKEDLVKYKCQIKELELEGITINREIRP